MSIQTQCLKKIYKLIKFNQKSLPKSYIDMNTDLTKAAKNEVDFSS